MTKTILTAATALLLCVPALAQTTAPPTTTPAPRGSAPAQTAKPVAPPTAPVNVNTASAAQLTTIPGVSSQIAADIIRNRPYRSSADLVKKVKGIGPHNVKKMLPFISF